MRPLHTSTPDNMTTHRKKGESTKNVKNLGLLINNINFQSVKTTQGELLNLIESKNPDVIFGTENWIEQSIKDSQFLPSGFTTYFKDRNLWGGGVIIAVKNHMLASAVPEFETECEVVWCKLNVLGHKTIYLSTFYNPKTSTEEGFLIYYKSMERACRVNNAVILSGRDFNLPGINLETKSMKKGAQHVAIHTRFIESIDDLGLTQIVNTPTRGTNTLDLVLTNYLSSANRVEVMQGLSDHEVVFVELNVSPVKIQHPRKIPLYSKANWDDRSAFYHQKDEGYGTPN